MKYFALMAKCEIKFAHIRFSEYFTFAKQIFHCEAISLACEANFIEKHLHLSTTNVGVFLVGDGGFEPPKA